MLRGVRSVVRLSSSVAAPRHHAALVVPTRVLSSSAAAPGRESWESEYARQHVPTTPLQKMFLLGASSALALLNTHRGDLVSTVGETLMPEPALRACRDRLRACPEGREILAKKPRVLDAVREHHNAALVAAGRAPVTSNAALPPAAEEAWLSSLHALPATTFGHAYACYMRDHGYLPSGRTPVRFLSDPELAYVMQRYREAHDFLHVLGDVPPTVEGELALKALEFLQTGLPMTGVSVLGAGALRLSGEERARLFSRGVPWARRVHAAVNKSTAGAGLVCVPFEAWFARDLSELRAATGTSEKYT